MDFLLQLVDLFIYINKQAYIQDLTSIQTVMYAHSNNVDIYLYLSRDLEIDKVGNTFGYSSAAITMRDIEWALWNRCSLWSEEKL